MCGIAGIISPLNNIRDAECRKMASVMHHRGPDDEGFYSDDSIALGHKRLSIIDLTHGRQPIFNEDKRLVLVYNGEIYNFRELREELISAGHKFETNTDSEVIIHSYEEWGRNSVRRFNGMFAFALWDSHNKTLFAARDRIGMKPFYYHQNGKGEFYFASEIKAMFECRDVIKRPNRESIADFLTFQNLLDNKTFFEGIFELPPGTYAVFQDGKFKVEKYWEIEFGSSNLSVSEAHNKFVEIMNNAAKRHLISDVPLGAYLSGGFDSSTVAYFASKNINEPLTSFTGAFVDEKFYDERPYSRALASHIGANMREVEITPNDMRELLPTVMYHLDEPSIGSGALPQYVVSRLVGQHVKVVLTGHGGDELFCGYQVFKAHHIMENMRKSFLDFFYTLYKIKKTEIFHILYFTFFSLLEPDLKHGLFIMSGRKKRNKLFGELLNRSLKDHSPVETLNSVLPDSKLPAVQKLTYLYLKTYLPTLLIQEDKVGMAHSIEARIPYLDNEMIDFALSLEPGVQMHGGELKSVVKYAMKNYLPELLYEAPKRGFPTPIAVWFRGPLRGWVEETLLGKGSMLAGDWLSRNEVKQIIDSFMRFRTVRLYDYAQASRIYSLLSLEVWFRRFFG